MSSDALGTGGHAGQAAPSKAGAASRADRSDGAQSRATPAVDGPGSAAATAGTGVAGQGAVALVQQAGQRYRDYYRGPVYVVNDYGHYHVRRPPRGYHWVRDDRGNLLMVAIATGIIADLLLHH